MENLSVTWGLATVDLSVEVGTITVDLAVSVVGGSGGGGGGGSVTITSPDSSIVVGGSTSAPTLEVQPAGTAGTYGDASHTLTIVTNSKGQVTSVTSNGIAITHSAVTDWAAALASALTGYFNTAGAGLSSSGSTVSLPSVGTAGTSGDSSHTVAVTVDAYGRVTGITVNAIAIAQSQVTGLTASLASLASLAGATFTGPVILAADPTQALGAATKEYVDAVAANLSPKESVVAVATANVALTGLPTTDGVTLTAGQRILLTAQTTASQNGIWLVAAGAWARPADYASGSSQIGSYTFVEQGTTYAASGFVQTGAAATVDTSSTSWTQFSGAGEILAGTGITKTGNTLAITATAVSPNSYGSASSVATFTVNAQGQLTAAGSTTIAIAQSQVTGLVAALASCLQLSGGTMSGAIAMAANKITGLANGTAATDAAAFGQIPQGQRYTKLSSNGATWSVPAGVTVVRVKIRGAGGGGGGGGSTATGAQLQVGGAGGGAGEVKEEWVTVTPGGTLTAVLNAGGSAGSAAPTGANNGGAGGAGGTSSLTDSTLGTIITANGGAGGGGGATGTTVASGGTMGGAGDFTPQASAAQTYGGGGGISNTTSGPPVSGVVGGAGGFTATATFSGTGGGASTVATNSLVVFSPKGSAPSTTTATAGVTATTPGCGGGGGGGGCNTGGTSYAGATGGAGAIGVIEIWY